jgi:hypothetical protein
LAHHLGWGFDHVAIADNDSTDATQDVIGQFGDAVTATRISNPYDRYVALAGLLEQIEGRHGAVDWCGVSDTDEFWWAPGPDIRRLLEKIPETLLAVNSEQKLFLPTEVDPPSGPVYCRRTFRTSSTQSPLHSSYRTGKVLYRGAWVRTKGVTNPHWSWGIRGRVGRFDQPLIHHYMIDGEDSFVDKVKSLERWGTQVFAEELRKASRGWTPPMARPFKAEWWRLYEVSGEAGLRDYYRKEYLISAKRLNGHLERGDLIQDTQFASFKRSSPTTWVEAAVGHLKR